MSAVRLNNLILKYQRFTPEPDCKDKEIRKVEFVAKTRFLCKWLQNYFPFLKIKSTNMLEFPKQSSGTFQN